MRQRLNKALRSLWAKHVASILKQYGHEQLKNEHAELQQKWEALRQENEHLRAESLKVQHRETRAFPQLSCIQDGCQAGRVRAGLCMSHYVEQRLTRIV